MLHPYDRIEHAIEFIRAHAEAQPALAEVAAAVGLSPYHFQRLFRAWTGISPKRYLAALTVSRAKALLAERATVLDAAHGVGLSGPSRLHDLFVTLEAASPGEYRARGAGLAVAYGVHSSPFGSVLLAQTGRGVCLLAFIDHNGLAAELARLRRMYGRARLRRDQALTQTTMERIFVQHGPPQRILLTVRGTNFQMQVWRALLALPSGSVISYRELAESLGRPRAARAVAGAVADNPVNLLIPCHRVLRNDGAVGGFRGGAEVKMKLLAGERPPRPAVCDKG